MNHLPTTLCITPTTLVTAYLLIGAIIAIVTCGLNLAHGDLPRSRLRLLHVFLRLTLTWPYGVILSSLMVLIKLIKP